MRPLRLIVVAVFLTAVLAPPGTALAAGLADSPWPMFQGDVRHTGRSAVPGPSSPLEKWSFKLQGLPGSPVLAPDGTIYVPTGMLNQDETGYLYALKPSGTLKWRYQFAGLPSSTAPAVGADGTIYVHMNGDEGNIAAIEKLYALTPEGALKWIFKPSGDNASFASSIQSSPAIGADGTIYVGSMNTALFAVNPDGSMKWGVSPSASSITASPALGPDGTIYCIDAASTLVAMNPDGTAKWLLELGDSTGGDGSPSVGADGTVYVLSGESKLTAVTPTGSVKWAQPIGNDCVGTPAIAADGTIYLGNDGLHALHSNGTARWTYRPDTLFSSVSPLIGGDGTIYWRESWTFYAVSRAGGTKWKLAIPAPDSSGLDPAPAIGADGTLYVPQPDIFNHGKQYLRAYFTRAACRVTLKLSGLAAGSSKLGKRVTASGVVMPAGKGATRVTLTVQRQSGGRWIRAKTATAALSANGAYSWGFRPGSRGSYRIQAGVAATPTTRSGTSPWRAFRVK